MTSTLPSGIPSITDYQELVGSPEFADLAEYSDRFLATNRQVLRGYRRMWVADPLHQWSRQWEYPFVLSGLMAEFGGRAFRILDAGSGVTFFPFLLADRLTAEVHCCDHDPTLAAVFNQVNQRVPVPVTFDNADLRALPHESGTFDAAYCVSVLEHTDRRADTVRELHRVLRPGGLLLLTIDLPTHGGEEDPEYTRMVTALTELFDSDGPVDVRSGAGGPDTVTTNYAAAIDRRLLPWRHPILYRLGCLVSGHGWVAWPPGLTVACFRLTRRAGP